MLTALLILVLLIAVTAELAVVAGSGSMATLRRSQTLQHELAVDNAVLWIDEQLSAKNGKESSLLKDLEALGQVELSLTLGELTVKAWIRSDAGKLNPLRWQGPDQLTVLTRKLSILQQRFSLPGRINLQPVADQESSQRYQWFDQLVSEVQPESLFPWVESDLSLRNAVWSDVVTLWGDGKIDLRYAQAHVLEAALEDIRPGLAGAILAAKTAKSIDPINAAVTQLPDEIRTQVAQRLTFGARRFAIRMQTAIGADRRQWYVVMNLGGEKHQVQVLHRSQLTW